jgi:hypothetical protein
LGKRGDDLRGSILTWAQSVFWSSSALAKPIFWAQEVRVNL